MVQKIWLNLNMIWPKNETEDLSLSMTKNCETPIKHLIQNLGKQLNLNLLKQGKHFFSIRQSQSKDAGWKK